MGRLATPRRAALTGYPLQNNLDEYYAMICWVQPDLMGTPAEFKVRLVVVVFCLLCCVVQCVFCMCVVLLGGVLSLVFTVCLPAMETHSTARSHSPLPPQTTAGALRRRDPRGPGDDRDAQRAQPHGQAALAAAHAHAGEGGRGWVCGWGGVGGSVEGCCLRPRVVSGAGVCSGTRRPDHGRTHAKPAPPHHHANTVAATST